MEENFIEKLEKYCLRNNISKPKYETTENNGSFLSKVTLDDGNSEEGLDITEIKAKNWAARGLLSKIESKSYEDLNQSLKQISLSSNITNSSSLSEVTTHSQSQSIFDEVIGNPIGGLQELCVQKKCPVPKYEQVGRSGEDHEPTFIFECRALIDGREVIGRGVGKSKTAARKASAADVLTKIRGKSIGNKSQFVNNDLQNVDSSSENENKLFRYFSETFSNNSELNAYIGGEDSYCKKLEKIAAIIGCGISYIESKDGNTKVMLRLVITNLANSNNNLFTTYGSSNAGLEVSKEIAAKKAILMLKILNCKE